MQLWVRWVDTESRRREDSEKGRSFHFWLYILSLQNRWLLDFYPDESVSWCYFSMFSFNYSSQFVQRFKPILYLVISQHFSTLRISTQRKPIKIIPSKFKRFPSDKLSSKKPNSELRIYAREKIRKLYNILKYSTWDSAHEQLEKLDIKWDSFTVTQVLKTHPPMEKAWLFFNWVSRKEKFRHDMYIYTTMMDIFGEAGRISSMMFVFNQMKEKMIEIDVVTYTSLMHWTSNAGDVDGAMKLWKEMKEKGCCPTVVSYTAYIRTLLRHKKVNEATGVYKEMLETGLSPNCYTYTVLMEYLASSGKFEEALEIFDRMQETGEHPDKAACNILIEICSGAREVRAMTKILHYMKEKFLVLRYPIYQKALETMKSLGESELLLRQVNRHLSEDDSPGTPLDIENGLVWNLLNKRNLIAVDSLLADLMENNIRLDSNVISYLIEVSIASHRQNAALLAYEYSKKLQIDIDRAAYLALIASFVQSNSSPKLVGIVQRMLDQGHSLGTHLNSLVIHHLGCKGDAASAAKVFNLLPHEEKSTTEFTALIGAFFSSGNADKGLETFEEMNRLGVEVAVGTYCVLMAGLEKCGSKAGVLQTYAKEKEKLDQKRHCARLSMDINICNLLFAGHCMTRNAGWGRGQTCRTNEIKK